MKKLIVSLMLISAMAQLQALMPIKANDPYEILGVSPYSSRADIRKNYLGLIFQNHPDKNLNQIGIATANTQKITAAYRELMSRQ